jgi:hypothetical protein
METIIHSGYCLECSKRYRDCGTGPNLAKRLDCGAFTAAFARAVSQRTSHDLCPLESGAEVTALQTLARLPGGLEPCGASWIARGTPANKSMSCLLTVSARRFDKKGTACPDRPAESIHRCPLH